MRVTDSRAIRLMSVRHGPDKPRHVAAERNRLEVDADVAAHLAVTPVRVQSPQETTVGAALFSDFRDAAARRQARECRSKTTSCSVS